MAQNADNDLVVTDTDGTKYSLIEGPNKDSRYVVAAQEQLTKTLQINELAVDLANVGKFLLMAQCGVMGHLQLELKVRERLHSVVKLCDDTVHTLNEFDRASSEAISNMASAYEYLLEGFEDIALETLHEVGETSKTMAGESSQLEKRFNDEATEVEKVQQQTLIERHQVSKENEETKKSIELHEEKQSSVQKQLSEAEVEEKKALKQLEDTMKKEKEIAEKRKEIAEEFKNRLEDVQKKLDAADIEARMACNQASTGFWAGLGSAFTHLVGGKTEDDIRSESVQISYSNIKHQHQDAILISKEQKEAADASARLQKEHRERHIDELKDRRKKRDEANKQMAEVARKLMESQFKENIQKESLYCLHHALTALRNLQSIMQVAANFWRETHSACNAITGHAMTRRLDAIQSMDEAKRKRLWNARGFKMEAVKYYAQWVAIQQMCSMSRVSLVNSQRQVHMFIRQNPTKEQGKELLGILAGELAKLDIKPSEEKKDT